MTTKSRLSSIALVAGAFTGAMLIAGGSASAEPRQAFRVKHFSIVHSGNGTGNMAVARFAAPMSGLKRAVVETPPPAPLPIPIPVLEPFPKPGDFL